MTLNALLGDRREPLEGRERRERRGGNRGVARRRATSGLSGAARCPTRERSGQRAAERAKRCPEPSPLASRTRLASRTAPASGTRLLLREQLDERHRRPVAPAL